MKQTSNTFFRPKLTLVQAHVDVHYTIHAHVDIHTLNMYNLMQCMIFRPMLTLVQAHVDMQLKHMWI